MKQYKCSSVQTSKPLTCHQKCMPSGSAAMSLTVMSRSHHADMHLQRSHQPLPLTTVQCMLAMFGS